MTPGDLIIWRSYGSSRIPKFKFGGGKILKFKFKLWRFNLVVIEGELPPIAFLERTRFIRLSPIGDIR